MNKLEETIKAFGDISYDYLLFKFRQGNNYSISNNGFIAKKSSGGDNWNCVIVGDKEIPKNRIGKWKIKINGNKTKQNNNDKYSDIYIGIGPKSFQGNLYDECWSIFSSSSKVFLQNKTKYFDYKNLNINIKKGDIIEVIVDRKLGNISYSINGINYGLAFQDIPKEDILYPTVVLYEQGLSVEIV